MAIIMIVTKPLQILIASAIIEQIGSSATMLIVDSFDGASNVAQSLKEASLFQVEFVQTRQQAIEIAAKAKPESVFMDSDVGVRIFCWLAKLKLSTPRTRICVYEEGVGTYRNDIYTGYKNLLFPKIGVATRFGHSFFTSATYVYDPQRYMDLVGCSGEVVKIQHTVSEILERNLLIWRKVFSFCETPNPRHNECTVYLTNWTPDQQLLNKLEELEGQDIFVKPHPHIREPLDIGSAHLLPAGVPGELLLLLLAQKYDRVTVLHHGTSIVLYVSNSKVHFDHI